MDSKWIVVKLIGCLGFNQMKDQIMQMEEDLEHINKIIKQKLKTKMYIINS